MNSKTASLLFYGDLSRKAPRAVGSAMRKNPFPLIVPCHRVSSKSGKEHYSIVCYSKKPVQCSGCDVDSCSKRIKKMVREYEHGK
jgi:O-6-methylguanine DNA methyltransferase